MRVGQHLRPLNSIISTNRGFSESESHLFRWKISDLFTMQIVRDFDLSLTSVMRPCSMGHFFLTKEQSAMHLQTLTLICLQISLNFVQQFTKFNLRTHYYSPFQRAG